MHLAPTPHLARIWKKGRAALAGGLRTRDEGRALAVRAHGATKNIVPERVTMVPSVGGNLEVKPDSVLA